MFKRISRFIPARFVPTLVALGSVLAIDACGAAGSAVSLPNPGTDVAATSPAAQSAVFAGGCFWGVEAVFRHVKGVTSAVSGYAGGSTKAPGYELVSTGTTGHAEAVKVTYDPTLVSYGQLLKIFFSVAHDPTQLNRQGPDVGTQYRSAIFYSDDEQKRVTQAYVAQLDQARAFAKSIVTQVAPLETFYPAEAYHQNYLALHPNQPYIVMHDMPKLAALREVFPDRYRAAQ